MLGEGFHTAWFRLSEKCRGLLKKLADLGQSWGRRRALRTRPIRYPESRYELVHNKSLCDDTFLSLQDSLFYYFRSQNEAGFGQPSFFLESGRLEAGRRYFFIKPSNAKGWLCEQAPNGW